MKGAHFPPTFPHLRFLERKLGKELCAKLRFASGDAALRGGRGRSVLSSDGKNQRSPGDGSDERLRAAGAHSHLVPTPSGPSGHLPLTGGVGPRSPCCGSGYLWVFGKFRRTKSRSVPVLFSAHRGLLPFKFGCSCVLMHTAWYIPTCLVRRWSGGLTATVMPG